MNLEQQVAHLKLCITDLVHAYRQSTTSLEDWFNALWNAEQALNIHDCQDPAVGCSCAGGAGWPSSIPVHVHSDECKHVLGSLPVPGATTCAHCGDNHTSIEYCPQRCPMAHAALVELNRAGA